MNDGPASRSRDDLPATVPVTWRLLLGLVSRLPQGVLSRLTGRLADLPIPRPLRRFVLGTFSRVTGIDVSEAERPLRAYASVGDFFVRRLAPGSRRWPNDPATLSSPVDGTIGTFGTIRDGTILQVKGRPYRVASLLDDVDEGARFEGGQFLTLYLSPRDYHRVHTPFPGLIARAHHVPGALLPVNAHAVRHVPDLFPRNERVACYLDGEAGHVAVVAVGAFNVGRIELAFDEGWSTNRRGAVAADRRYAPAVTIGRTDELMVFHLGSTIVLLFEPARVTLTSALESGQPVRLGQPIGSVLSGRHTAIRKPDQP